MSSKTFNSNLTLLIFLIQFNSLFLLVSTKQGSEKNIFDKTQLKHLKLKNRFFRGAVGENGLINGKIPNEIFQLYDQLSKNEVVNIFTGLTIVSDYNPLPTLNQFRMDKDEYIPEYKKLVDMVHKNGANIFMQLGHIGINVNSKHEIVYSPSSVPVPNQNMNSKEMTKEDILRIENDFAEAALRAKKAGFDGIEIHGAHFYLVSDFLSPLYNKRTDEYGGSDEKRARFLVEVLEKIREKVGKDFIVGVKINCEDGDEKGITPEGFLKACLMAEAAGSDFIDVSGMSWMREKTKNLFYEKVGTDLSQKLKIPVMVTAGARNVDELNEILNKSNIQYFGIARPLICEYDLLKRWKNGETKKSKCISCSSCLFKHLGICVFNKKKCDIKSAQPAPFQRITLGEYKITYLPDGEGYTIPTFAYHGSTEEDWKKYKQYLNKEGKSLMSIGSFLIEYKNEKILFDLGLGKNHFSSPEGNCDGGELLNNLQKAGLVRRDITKVIFSNFHPEHVGWTSMDINGKRFLTFNNADYYSSKNEWDFWKDKINEPIGIDPINFKEPLEGKIKFLKDGEEIIPNLFVRYEFGNTPGSINLILKAEGKRIWFIGDMVHSDLQFENPHWSYYTDNNEEKAIKTKKSVLDDLSQKDTIIANGHFIEEAFGYLEKEGEEKYKFKRYTN